MDNKSIVSVIVPIYKVEEYLEDCIESIINQTYKNIEIILVDDGSPDNCGKMCDEYALKDERIKVIHKENGGLSSARNAGLDIARGEYISFIDSDDYISKNFIKNLMKVMTEYNVEVAQCDFTRKILDLNENEFINKDEVKILNKDEAMYNLNILNHGKYVIACNKLYKKDLFEKIRFPKGKINEDTYVTYKIFYETEKNIAILNQKLYFYRERNNSIMTNKFSIKNYDALEGYKSQVDFFKEKKQKKYRENALWVYQKHLKDFWYKTEENITNKKQTHLKQLLKESRKILSNILCSKVFSVKEKIIYLLFDISPKMYFSITKIFKNIKVHRDAFKYFIKYLKYKFLVKKDNEYILFGMPTYGNIGDHAIAVATEKFFLDNGKVIFEIDSNDSKNEKLVSLISKFISKKAKVCIIGGGFVGSLWELGQKMIQNVVQSFSQNQVILFPQTLFYDNNDYGEKIKKNDTELFNNHSNLFLFWREQKSYEVAQEIFYNNKNYLCPDMALYLDGVENITEKNNKVLLCLRSDKEKTLRKQVIDELIKVINQEVEYTDTVIDEEIKRKDSSKMVLEKINQFGKYNLVITDRLHGMVMCALAQTPCIAIDNASHKVKGVYEKWLNKLDYILFIDSENDLIDSVSNFKKINSCRYNIDKGLYNKLREILNF